MTQLPTEPLLFNPLDPEVRCDPYPLYARLRADDPIHKSPLGFWVLSRYAECASMLRDGRAGADLTKSSEFARLHGEPGAPQASGYRVSPERPFLFVDAPDHGRLRRLVSKAFTPSVVERLRGRAESVIDDQLDAIEPTGTVELIEAFAYPVTVVIICELLGVPASDRDLFRDWSRDVGRALDPDFVLEEDLRRRLHANLLAFTGYFRELIAERRRRPRSDLISSLIAAEEQGSSLSANELLSTCVLLLVAGHETTANLIGNAMLALLRHPSELIRVAQRPEHARLVVEEVLRWDPPVQLTGRVALEDIRLGDVVIPAGDEVVLLIASANRDPAQFPTPERFDPSTADTRHLAFSGGPHFCLGAPLARLEAQVAILKLAGRLRNPVLAEPSVQYRDNVVLRALSTLTVTFEPTTSQRSSAGWS